jgi:sugar phosphate isomerase/epimerase
MKSLLICDGTEPEDFVLLCHQRRIGIEVQAFYHPDALHNEDLIRKTIELVSGLPTVSLHGPFGDLNPGSFDSLVRKTARQRIQEGLDVTMRLNAGHVVFHTGRVPRAGPEQSWIKRATGFWESFMKQVPEDLNVYLENMLEGGPQILVGLIDGVSAPNLRANLDIGHAHCNSCTQVLDWIAALRERIGYVHMSDNHGVEDEHLGLGRGSIPMEAVCDALEEVSPDAIWAIEAEGIGVEESLAWLDAHDYDSSFPRTAPRRG